MAQGIRPDEQFLAPVVYADIIDLPRWEPGPKHPRMSLYKRAAQFMPFAAVRGYNEMIREDLRETEPEAELSEGQQELLARQLAALRARLAAGEQPAASVTGVVPDAREEGGEIRYAVSGGYADIDGEKVIVLANRAADLADEKAEDVRDKLSELQGALNALDEDDPNAIPLRKDIEWNELIQHLLERA